MANNKTTEKTSIKIDYSNRIIEITKTFSVKASKYGSDEYQALQNARTDNPGFRVVITKRKASASKAFKGLTFDYMEQYIQTHDDEKGSTMMEYYRRRGIKEKNPEALPSSESYGRIKKWFFEQYESFAEACGVHTEKRGA
ncbi:MAG: hypothetical protein IJX82_01380 [Clostridia bacterium]|nr:hypothetical protein [Clostridia bacterium]